MKSRSEVAMKYPHYFKPIPPGATHVDVYRVLLMFGVTDPCIGHAVKKLLVAGGRGGKDVNKDIGEAIDALVRWQAMRAEDVGDRRGDGGGENRLRRDGDWPKVGEVGEAQVGVVISGQPNMLFNPYTGCPLTPSYIKTPDAWRGDHSWRFNPWTGTRRAVEAVESDPYGIGIWESSWGPRPQGSDPRGTLIDWPGGACPFPPETEVSCLLRDGASRIDKASGFRWYGELPDSVVKYRVYAGPRRHA